ncbi:DUF4407 domain-containing protein [Aeromonas caviae]
MNVKTLLYFFSATDRVLLEGIPSERCSYERILREGLGIVSLVNFLVLLMSWVTVCQRYFGLLGILPGCLVPCAFIAVDRIIIMSPELRGELAVYNSKKDSIALFLRIITALVLSMVTTITLQLELSQDLIRDQARHEYQQSNASLRLELQGQLLAGLESELETLQRQQEDLNVAISKASAQRDSASNTAQVYTIKAVEASDEAQQESGGLDGRPFGELTRYRAQQALAELYRSSAKTASDDAKQAAAEAHRLTKLRDTVAHAIKQAVDTKSAMLLGNAVDGPMQLDPRYKAIKTGVYAEITHLLHLYRDSSLSTGVWVASIMTWAVMLTLELAALLAWRISPPSVYSLSILCNTRSAAADMVSKAEQRVHKTYRNAPINIVADADADADEASKAA